MLGLYAQAAQLAELQQRPLSRLRTKIWRRSWRPRRSYVAPDFRRVYDPRAPLLCAVLPVSALNAYMSTSRSRSQGARAAPEPPETEMTPADRAARAAATCDSLQGGPGVVVVGLLVVVARRRRRLRRQQQ